MRKLNKILPKTIKLRFFSNFRQKKIKKKSKVKFVFERISKKRNSSGTVVHSNLEKREIEKIKMQKEPTVLSAFGCREDGTSKHQNVVVGKQNWSGLLSLSFSLSRNKRCKLRAYTCAPFRDRNCALM